MDEKRAAESILGYSDVGYVFAVCVWIRVVVEDVDCILRKHRYSMVATEACLDQRAQTCRTWLLLMYAPPLLPNDAATSELSVNATVAIERVDGLLGVD